MSVDVSMRCFECVCPDYREWDVNRSMRRDSRCSTAPTRKAEFSCSESELLRNIYTQHS